MSTGEKNYTLTRGGGDDNGDGSSFSARAPQVSVLFQSHASFDAVSSILRSRASMKMDSVFSSVQALRAPISGIDGFVSAESQLRSPRQRSQSRGWVPVGPLTCRYGFHCRAQSDGDWLCGLLGVLLVQDHHFDPLRSRGLDRAWRSTGHDPYRSGRMRTCRPCRCIEAGMRGLPPG